MTQIVGIVCKDSIIVASESQYTTGTRKLLNAVKLSIVKFQNGDALIAESGPMSKSSLAVRYIEEAAKNKKIESQYTVSKIAENAIKRIRHEILETMQERSYSPQEQEDVFLAQSNYFALMIAHYFSPKKAPSAENERPPIPCLYTISLSGAIAESCSPFAMLGAAPELALFILKQFQCEQLVWGEATCLAIDALDRIVKDDITCGGEILVGTVHPTLLHQPTATFYGGSLVRRALTKIQAVRKKNDERYKIELGKVMKKIHQEDYKLYAKQIAEHVELQNRWRLAAAKNNPVTVVTGRQ
jgi:20S proteasome alpha/beta subunit